MALNDLIDEDEASQKLNELNNLIDQNASSLEVWGVDDLKLREYLGFTVLVRT